MHERKLTFKSEFFSLVLFISLFGCSSRNDTLDTSYMPPAPTEDGSTSTTSSTTEKSSKTSTTSTSKKKTKRIILEDDGGEIEQAVSDETTLNSNAKTTTAGGGKGTAATPAPSPAAAEIVVSGTVRRSIAIQAGGDGRGTVCVYITNFCPTRDNLQSLQLFGTPIQILNADLSTNMSQLEFSIPIRNNLATNTYVIAASLLEDGRACGRTYNRGDLLTFGANGCPRFNFQEGTSATGLSVVLNDFIIQNFGQ
ncbi:MAG: hypothetical protein HQK54_08930 [Oligoflexales bacterium]|nr:hypothetical protein [Oligoflexales bacterium]